MKKLYEVLVPTIYGDTIKPIRTKHHKEWDKRIRSLTGGLTIMAPAKGQWVYNDQLFEERIIPVKILCDESLISQIIDITLNHYRQKAVMYYVLSNECYVVNNKKLT